MKKIVLLGSVALAGLMFSCSSSDDGGEAPIPEGAEKLRVVVAVLDQDGNAINVQEAKGNSTKDYVMVGNAFQHRVLIEDFTGAWCGWCPRVSHSIETLEQENNDKVVAVALHNNDKLRFTPYEGNLSNTLWTKFGIPSNQRGYPFAALNRQVEWETASGNAMNLNQVLNAAKPSSTVGIKISSKLEKDKGTVNVSLKFSETYSGTLNYVVYVVQDGIVLSQENYTTNYGGKGTKKDFVHNSVAKAITGSIMGETVPSDKTTSGSEFTTGDLNVTYKAF